MQKILVTTDFSDCSTQAINYAINLAEEANAEVIILNVFTNVDTTFSDRKELVNEYNHTIALGIEEQLNELQQRLFSKNAKAKVSVKLYRGPVQDSILQCAADERVDVIVMGTRGASGLRKLLIGSTTASIIGNTTVPVLAIPKEAKWQGLRNILFASRHLTVDSKVLMPIMEFARLDGAMVHVVTFTDTDDTDVADYMEHGRLLNLYHQQLPERYKDIKFKTEHLEGSEFDEAIQHYINENKIDMMIMTTHKRSFWESLFNSSITKNIAFHTTIPLLAIPE
jgi:nucleotide-binding universal stress UspA family protein